MRKVIALLILLTILALSYLNCSKSNSETDDELIIPIEIAKVKRSSVSKELKYTGDILAEQDVKVFSKVPDRIVSFSKDEGDYVREGEEIAKIEATKIEQVVIQANAALVSAQAQLANLESEYNRAKRLKTENAMSQQQYDGVATQYEAMQSLVKQSNAALIQAKSQLEDATITAPISGIIGVRNYEQGDMASGPLPLVTVVQMEKVKVIINVPEQDMGKLKLGLCATLSVLSYNDTTFQGRINKISPVLDPVTRMGKIEIIVDNKNYKLKPGMFAEVLICINTLEDVIVVPKYSVIENTALKRKAGEEKVVVNSQVFVEKDGYAYMRNVDIGYTNGIVAVVDKGLDEGENVVIIGQQSLKDSARVKIVNSSNVD